MSRGPREDAAGPQSCSTATTNTPCLCVSSVIRDNQFVFHVTLITEEVEIAEECNLLVA